MLAKVQPPPRLLIGAALLFWGAMSGHPIIGLILALAIEGANWIRLRWDFNEQACSFAWRLSMFIAVVSGVLIWLEGSRYTALPKLMIWLPIILLPMQWVQSFGLKNEIPLNALSLFGKYYRNRNLRLGLSESALHFNFGNAYLISTLIASSLAKNATNWIFLPAIILIGGSLVFSRVNLKRSILFVFILFAGIMGLFGQMGMNQLYSWVTHKIYGFEETGANLFETNTSIGTLGKIKQSPEMLWRIHIKKGGRIPRLLRLATFNTYKGVSWKNNYPPQIKAEITTEEADFSNLATREPSQGNSYYILREDISNLDLSKALPSYQLRGAIRAEAPLPLPGDTATLQHFELDDIESNPIGSIRVFPKRSIIEGTIRWKDDTSFDPMPWPEQDLQVNHLESEIVHQIVAELGLRDLRTTEEKISRLKTWFIQEFSYTRYLTIQAARHQRPSAITLFLTTSKKGHCEYFATAAALILRAANIPTRYCVGYSVMEQGKGRNEYVIRGTHAHAWTRVWDQQENKWIDFDPTPPSWFTAEMDGNKESRWLADHYQRFKEDFFLWRNRPANRLGARIVMSTLAVGVFLFIGVRLWKSKLKVDSKTPLRSHSASRSTSLQQLDKKATQLLGQRPIGMTYSTWLLGLENYINLSESLKQAIEIHQSIRFDPAAEASPHHERLHSLTQKILTQLQTVKKPK